MVVDSALSVRGSTGGRRGTGFTLIELLVVISIIAILAFILFPVFAKARKASQKAVCMSNLKQLYSAVRQYANDYEGDLPAMVEPWMWDNDGDRAAYWRFFMFNQLSPYIKDKEICACPAWKAIEKHPATAAAAALSPYSWGPDGYSWGVSWLDNGPFCDPSWSNAGFVLSKVRCLDTLREPTKYVLMYCNTPNDHSGFGDSEVAAGVNRTYNLASIFCHGDGHVDLIRFYGGTTWDTMGEEDAMMWRLWWNGGYAKGEYAFAEDTQAKK